MMQYGPCYASQIHLLSKLHMTPTLLYLVTGPDFSLYSAVPSPYQIINCLL